MLTEIGARMCYFYHPPRGLNSLKHSAHLYEVVKFTEAQVNRHQTAILPEVKCIDVIYFDEPPGEYWFDVDRCDCCKVIKLWSNR